MDTHNGCKKEGPYTIATSNILNTITTNKRKWYYVDKNMIPFKLHFFLLTGGLGSVTPLVPVLVKNRIGLSATSFASVLMVLQFLFVFTKPVIGFITDYFNKLKEIIGLLALVQGIFYFLLLVAPRIPNKMLHHNQTYLDVSINNRTPCDLCSNFIGSLPEMNLHVHLVNESLKKSSSFEFTVATNVLRIHCASKGEGAVFERLRLNDTIITQPYPVQNEEPRNIGPSINPLNHEFNVQILCDSPDIVFKNCSYCCNGTTLLSCADETKKSSEAQTLHVGSQSDFMTKEFWIFAIVFAINNICNNAIFTLSETACCEIVHKHGCDFGKQRLWGAIGWGSMAAVAGFLDDYTEDYLPAMCVFGVFYIVMIWNISRMDLVKPQYSKNILKDIGTVMKSKDFLFFEVGVLVNGIGLGAMWFYLVWFVSSIGGSQLICGLVHTVQCFGGELPFMFFSGWMLKKMGYFNILSMSLIAYCVRFLWYSQLQDPWLVLPVEWTHGITYGVFYATMAVYAKMSAKPGTEATTQSVVFGTYDGLGCGIGNVLAGIGFDYYGAHRTFLLFGVFFGCSTAVSVTYSLLQRKNRKVLEVSNATLP